MRMRSPAAAAVKPAMQVKARLEMAAVAGVKALEEMEGHLGLQVAPQGNLAHWEAAVQAELILVTMSDRVAVAVADTSAVAVAEATASPVAHSAVAAAAVAAVSMQATSRALEALTQPRAP